jgi:hypothetical protein
VLKLGLGFDQFLPAGFHSSGMISLGTGKTIFGMGQEGHRQTVMLLSFGVGTTCTIAIGDLQIMQSGGGSVMGICYLLRLSLLAPIIATVLPHPIAINELLRGGRRMNRESMCHVAARIARLRFAFVQFSYLLIRGTARSILKAQHFIRQEFY